VAGEEQPVGVVGLEEVEEALGLAPGVPRWMSERKIDRPRSIAAGPSGG
jgi:hypothetical protein